jgi:multidrug efflux pump subunit AcrB
MSTSLIAVFIPILLMGGIVGKLFREFAVTLVGGHRRLAAGLADHHAHALRPFSQVARREPPWPHLRASERAFQWLHNEYATGLRWVLRHQWLILGVVIGTVALECLPLHHRAQGTSSRSRTRAAWAAKPVAAQDISFPAMRDQAAPTGADGD